MLFAYLKEKYLRYSISWKHIFLLRCATCRAIIMVVVYTL